MDSYKFVLLSCSPVVQHDVRQPDLVRRNVQPAYVTVLFRIPRQLLILPLLLQPHVRRHDLTALRLQTVNKPHDVTTGTC